MMQAKLHGVDLAPSPWVQRFLPLLPRSAPIVDLACGSGRHTRLLLQHGYEVLAVDRDATALAAIDDGNLPAKSSVKVMQIDLEVPLNQLAWPCAPGSLAGIIVTNYLHRPLFPVLLQSLAPDGVLIYETFAAGNGVFGKPSNPAFLLQPGELLAHMQESGVMRTIAFEDGYVEQPKAALVQRICSIKAGNDVDVKKLGPL